MQSSSKRSMRSRVCEQEVIVSTRKAVLFRKIHTLSIFPLERKRNWPETCVMRSHENDATPRGIMFTGATRSFPQACQHCTVWNGPSHPLQHLHPQLPGTLSSPAALLCWPLWRHWGNNLVSSSAHCTPTAARLLTYRRHCVLCLWVCSWLNRCTDRDTSVQQQSLPFIFLL